MLERVGNNLVSSGIKWIGGGWIILLLVMLLIDLNSVGNKFCLFIVFKVKVR